MDFFAKDHQRGDLAGDSQNDGAPRNTILHDFVFGNIDSSLQLEGNDLLDDDAKRMLSNLSRDVSQTVEQIINSADLQQQNLSDDDKAGLFKTAEDYYTIEETIPAVDLASAVRMITDHAPTALPAGGSKASAPLPASSSVGLPRHGSHKSYGSFAPSLSLPAALPARLSLPQSVDDITSDKPLASLLPPEMMDVDVRDVYSDFCEDKPLRWNKLFRAQIEPRFLPPKPSSTLMATTATVSVPTVEYHVIGSSFINDENDMPVARDSSGYSLEDFDSDLQNPWCPLTNSSTKADATSALGGQSAAENNTNPDGSRSDLGLDEYNWRHGVAECWYDKAGMSETGHEYFNRSRRKSPSNQATRADAASGTGMVVDELDNDLDGEDEEIANDALATKDFLKPFNLSDLNSDMDGPWMTSYLYEWEKDVVTDIDTDGGGDGLTAGKAGAGDSKHAQSATHRQWQIHVQRMRNMPWTSTYMMARVLHARKMQIEQQKTGHRNPNAVRDPHIEAILARYTDEELLYFQKMAMSQKSMVNEVEWEKDVLKFVHEGILPPPQPPLFFVRDCRTCLFKPDESKLHKPSEWKELRRKREECCEYINTVTPANRDIELALDAAVAVESKNVNLDLTLPNNMSRGLAATHHFKAVLQLGRQDFLNVSKDAEYYRNSVNKQAANAVTKSALKVSALSATHSIPAMQLYHRFFPPNWSRDRLRHFHRTLLRLPQRSAVPRACKPNTPHRLEVVTKYEIRATQRRQKLLAKLGGGTVMHMRQPHDLSAKDSELLLFEYSEEFPPLVLQSGMAANILNYARYPSTPAAYNPNLGDKYEYGNLTYCKKSPFLGQIGHGKVIPTIESSVFRAPIYQHDMPTTDFLVIRNKKKYFIRRAARIFCVGQECPLVEVPSPKSKRAVAIQQNLIQSKIVRLFEKSGTQPAQLDFAELTRMFPQREMLGPLRKKLRGFAKMEKQGKGKIVWKANKDYKLPQEEEIRELCRPDDYCALYSMRCAEQRLRDAGYGEAMEKLLQDDEAAGEKSLEEKTDDEIKAAPWNTTRAFLSAMQGKCMLEVQGVADPTGCGEGISYTRLRTKGREKGTTRAEAAARRLRKVQMAQQRSMVSGTKADLRKLTLQEARNMLSNHGFTKDIIWGMKRWEAIHLIRQVGIHEARAGQGGAFAKFSRGPKKSIQELMIKFRKDCQTLFTVQHQMLSATAADSYLSDDESDDGGGGEDGATKEKEEGAGITSASAGEIDWEAFSNQLESSMVQRGKTKHQIEHELEEKERRLLKQLLTETSEAAKKQAGDAEAITAATGAPSSTLVAVAPVASSSSGNLARLAADSAAAGNNKAAKPQPNRKLEIRRTYVDPVTNIPYSRTEVVKDPAIIDLYLRIRSAKSKSLLQRLLGVNETRGGGITAAQAKIRRSEGFASSSGTAAAGGSAASSSAAQQLLASGGTNADMQLDSVDGGAEEPRRRGRRPLADREKKIRQFKKEHMRHDRDREREKNARVQCSACGQNGHMRSNRICPKFDETYGRGASLRKGRPGAFGDEDFDGDDFADEAGGGGFGIIGGDAESSIAATEAGGLQGGVFGADGAAIKEQAAGAVGEKNTADEGGVRVEGTKLVFTKKLVESAQEDLQKKQQLKREEDEKQRLLREELNLSDDDTDDEDIDDDEEEDFSKRKRADADYRPPPHTVTINNAGGATAPAAEGGGLILKIRRDSLMINDGAVVAGEGTAEQLVETSASNHSPLGTYVSPSTPSDGSVRTPTAGESGSVGSGGTGERRLLRGSRRGGRSSASTNLPSTSDDVDPARIALGRMSGKRARPDSPSDLYSRPAKQVHQRYRTDPFVFINSRLDAVVKDLRVMPEAQLFLMPVRDVEFPDYRTHVQHPMDLNTIRLKVKRGAEPITSVSSVSSLAENDERMSAENVYRSRAEFLADLRQIVLNSELYNGPASEITNNARQLVAVAHARLYENEKISEELATEERRIDPLVDPGAEPVRCLNQFLQQVVEQTMKMDTTQQKIFCKPVSLKLLPDYAVRVARPIDLSVILDLCKRRNYTRLDQFRADVELIRFNSQTYNGNEHPITRTAGNIVDYALAKMDARIQVLQHFETRIQEQEQMRAVEAAEEAAAAAVAAEASAVAAGAAATGTTGARENFIDDVFSQPPSVENDEAAADAETGAAGILQDLELSDEEENELLADENDDARTAGRDRGSPDAAAVTKARESHFSSPSSAGDNVAGGNGADGIDEEEDDRLSSAARMMMMDIDDESVLARWRSDGGDGGDGENEYGEDADDTVISPDEANNASGGGGRRDSLRRHNMSGGMSKPSSERIATYSEPTSPETLEGTTTVSRNTLALSSSIGLPLPPMNFGIQTNRRVADEYDDDSDDELVVAPEDQIQQLQRPVFVEDDEVDMFNVNDEDDLAGNGGGMYGTAPSSPPLMMRPVGGGELAFSAGNDQVSVRQRHASGEQLSDDDEDEVSADSFRLCNKPASPTDATTISHAVDLPDSVPVGGDAPAGESAEMYDEFGDLLTFDSAARIAGYEEDEEAGDRVPVQPPLLTAQPPATSISQDAGLSIATNSSANGKGETLSDSSDEDQL